MPQSILCATRWMAPRRVAPQVVLIALLAALCAIGSPANADPASGGLIANDAAQRYGLERAWFSQAQLDPSRHRVEHATLYGDQIVVLTTAGVVHVMDAETGATIWIQRVGNPDYPSLGPAVGDKHVSLVNGSTVYVLERQTGREVLQRRLGGGAAGGPALTAQHVFVPLFNGKIEAYSVSDKDLPAAYFASAGRIYTAPVSTAESIIWPTDSGILYVANPNARGIRYRFESTSPLSGQPAAKNGLLYVTSASGYVYALRETSGLQQWRFATGAPVSRSPVVVGGRVFVATNSPSLYCLDAANGSLMWETPDIAQMVAVSKGRVYGINQTGDVTILDGATGVRQGRLQTNGITSAVLNEQTDRLYLISQRGLVQCLHEIGADEPLQHGVELDEALRNRGEKPEGPAEGEVNPFGVPADEEDPFGGGGDEADPFNPPAPAEDDPFNAAPPAANEPAGEDPFDF